MTGHGDRPSGGVLSAGRWIPLALLGGALALVLGLGLDDHLSLAALRDNREWLLAQVERHAVLSVIAYVAVYAGAVALSLPVGSLMTVAGGFLFGQVGGTACAVVAATLGAILLFLAARTAVGDVLRAKAGPWLRRMEAGFARNALSYLLVLRLVPLFPFFVVNLVPAFLGVPLRTFVVATFLGVIPGTFVYASVGAGLGSLFAAGGELSLESALTPEILSALVGLGLLALVPVFYRRFARSGSGRAES